MNVFSWRIGGAQGTGIDTAAMIFSRACAYAGYNVYGEREYHSNIKGMHSYFSVSVGVEKVRSVFEDVHLLAALDAETVVTHAWSVVSGGGIVFDSKVVGDAVESIPTLSSRLRRRVVEELRREGCEPTVEGVLELAERRGVKLIPLPYMELLRGLGGRLSDLIRASNVVAVAASAAVLKLSEKHLLKAVEAHFRGRRSLDLNLKVVKNLYPKLVSELGGAIGKTLPDVGVGEERYLVPGYVSAVLGKLAGGCRFQAYYPITPAQDECFFLESVENFRLIGGDCGSVVVVQSEDEISALGMALGAALTGVRAATATSGPGFSLMAETLGWAGMNEVPVVITLYQRCGPSTGMPTRREQGDALFAVFGGHGEFPRIVLASGDVEEAFYDAALALNLAERYQLPVIHLLDKALANSIQTIPKPRLEAVRIERGVLKDVPDSEYRRFELTETGVSPRAVIGGPKIFWNTGNEHDERGHVSEDPVLREEMMDKRMRKLGLAAAEIPEEEKVRMYGDGEAGLGLVGWGSTKGPILDAMELLKKEGVKSKFLQIRLIHPFPSGALRRFSREVERLVFVEQNYSGQLAKLAAMEAGVKPHHLIVKFSGRPFTPQELARAIGRALQTGEERVVSRGRWEA